MRALLLVALPFVAACGPAHDVVVQWTVPGGCAGFADEVRVRVVSTDGYDDDTPSETFTSGDCEAGALRVETGNVARVSAEALAGVDVVGRSATREVEPARTEDDDVVALVIEPTVGTASLSFRIAGRECDDRGVDGFDVFVRRLGGVDQPVVYDERVACDDGDERAVLPGLDVGASYGVRATATNDEGAAYATAGNSGAVVVVDGARVFATIELVAAP